MKRLDSRSDTASINSSAALAIIGFIVVACMLSTNNIVARANAGEIPSFSLAFFRWMTVAFGLTPFAVREIREKWSVISPRIWMVAAAGFCGMFLCGGPVYAAAVTTTAINIGLIMAAAPVNVFLIAWCFGLEKIKPVQMISVVVALAGVALILFRGSLETLTSVNFVPGDIIVLVSMFVVELGAAPAPSLIWPSNAPTAKIEYSPTAIYLHFKDKEDLFQELVRMLDLRTSVQNSGPSVPPW